MKVVFERNKETGEYTVNRARTIEEIRAMNKRWLKKRGIKAVTDEDMDNARAIFYKQRLKW